jgi:hypothetical protein
MATLPGSNAIVCVGPSLLARGPRFSWAPLTLVKPAGGLACVVRLSAADSALLKKTSRPKVLPTKIELTSAAWAPYWLPMAGPPA